MNQTTTKIPPASMQFTDEEKERFAEICERVAKKTVIHTVAKMVSERVEMDAAAGVDTAIGVALRDDILKIDTTAGSRPINVDISADESIVIFVAPCPQSHKAVFAVPPGGDAAREQVFAAFDFIKGAVHSYWNKFCDTNREICARLLEYMPRVDWVVKPALPNSATTMWFDHVSTHHMGIICMYKKDKKLYRFE